MGPNVAGTHSYVLGKKGGRGSLPPPTHNFAVHSSPHLPNKCGAPFPRVPFQPLVDSFDSKGGDYGEPNNGDSDDSDDSATRASIATSETWRYTLRTAALTTGVYAIATPQMQDAYSVDLLNSD